MQSNSNKAMLIDPNQTPEQAINNFGSYFARNTTSITSSKQPANLEDNNMSNVAFTFYDVDTLIILKQITIHVSLKSKDQIKKYVNVKQLPELPPRHYISVNNNNFIVKESEAGNKVFIPCKPYAKESYEKEYAAICTNTPSADESYTWKKRFENTPCNPISDKPAVYDGKYVSLGNNNFIARLLMAYSRKPTSPDDPNAADPSLECDLKNYIKTHPGKKPAKIGGFEKQFVIYMDWLPNIPALLHEAFSYGLTDETIRDMWKPWVFRQGVDICDSRVTIENVRPYKGKGILKSITFYAISFVVKTDFYTWHKQIQRTRKG